MLDQIHEIPHPEQTSTPKLFVGRWQNNQHGSHIETRKLFGHNCGRLYLNLLKRKQRSNGILNNPKFNLHVRRGNPIQSSRRIWRTCRHYSEHWEGTGKSSGTSNAMCHTRTYPHCQDTNAEICTVNGRQDETLRIKWRTTASDEKRQANISVRTQKRCITDVGLGIEGFRALTLWHIVIDVSEYPVIREPIHQRTCGNPFIMFHRTHPFPTNMLILFWKVNAWSTALAEPRSFYDNSARWPVRRSRRLSLWPRTFSKALLPFSFHLGCGCWYPCSYPQIVSENCPLRLLGVHVNGLTNRLPILVHERYVAFPPLPIGESIRPLLLQLTLWRTYFLELAPDRLEHFRVPLQIATGHLLSVVTSMNLLSSVVILSLLCSCRPSKSPPACKLPSSLGAFTRFSHSRCGGTWVRNTFGSLESTPSWAILRSNQ